MGGPIFFLVLACIVSCRPKLSDRVELELRLARWERQARALRVQALSHPDLRMRMAAACTWKSLAPQQLAAICRELDALRGCPKAVIPECRRTGQAAWVALSREGRREMCQFVESLAGFGLAAFHAACSS